ncbi:MAG: phosphomannomutase/phosphoglucomutase [candidate division Zixibacteria bacterium CG_4_9_14_3_um_filter_46_8]|nr:MAG: phosphomannomutase/phosphoglucomutase [candidate division Zixibacteria bacterium CG_4_9_14_3_um_filter_46_8]
MVEVDPKIFKAYDIRGEYPDEINEEIAYKIGRAFVTFTKASTVAVGRDMRRSSPQLSNALINGIADCGGDVVDIGMISTDGLYFAVGKFGYPAGVMITASHNPARYNGLKMCREKAVPISGETGIKEIERIIKKGRFISAIRRGKIVKKDVLEEYAKHVLSFVNLKRIKPFRIVIDAGNGMAGKLVPVVFKNLPCQIIPLYFELDGSFPNHPASPIEPENVVDLRRKVEETKADLGAAFDGDADRMFLCNEKSEMLGGDMVTALVAKNLLIKEAGARILYNLICSRTVPKVIKEGGGEAIRTRVGHAFIKAYMKEHNAVFGGEHSGHFYFRDNWFADSGMIALLVCLEVISAENKPLSEIIATMDSLHRSGEINSKVADVSGKLAEIEKAFPEARVDHLDGVTLQYDDWWFNVRPSNTEPLLRLNVEASSEEQLKEKAGLILSIIRR